MARPIEEGHPDAGRVRISLTMIVRDEETNLSACLGPIVDLFDEVIVIDTGSVDRTRQIALAHGARVIDHPWDDNFSNARNAALNAATGDYAFWLDADDRIDPAERECLARLLGGLTGERHAFVMRCATGRPDGPAPVLDQIRLFPLRGDVRWAYRVHEQVAPALERTGVDLVWSSVTIRHTGYDDARLLRAKLRRNARLLALDLADQPWDPFINLNAGLTSLELGEVEAALERGLAGLRTVQGSSGLARDLHALLAAAHLRKGDSAAAHATCTIGLAGFPDDAELLLRDAEARSLLGDWDGAETCWRRLLSTERVAGRFSYAAAGAHGAIPRRRLAALAEQRGRLLEAFRLWGEVLAECPGDTMALSRRRDAARALIWRFFTGFWRRPVCAPASAK